MPRLTNRTGVFISYARSDGEDFAIWLRQRLTQEEIPLWRDREGMEGGRDWWSQITEALDQVQFMVLVVTPNALKSDVVRKEWRYARQQGVQVYPIKAAPNLDFSTMPRWMRDQHFYDIGTPKKKTPGPEWQKFLNDLNKTPDLKRVPFMVKDLPADFVPRPGEFDRLIRRLLDDARENPVAITAALRGAGGYGKTTLAQAICHDARIQDAFDDGILWVTLGENPGDLNAKILELIAVLSGHKPDYTGTEAIAAHFRQLLADRDVLLVIDDVWNDAHLRPFLHGGERCARLITTRNPKTLPADVIEIPVDAMREAEAVVLLSHGLSSGASRSESSAQLLTAEAETQNELRKLAARLGKWPLLLRLANGVLRNRIKSGAALAAAITYANRALDKRGLKAFDANNPLERNQAVSATLAVSLDQLSEQERARFFALAIFPEDVYVPMATLEKYWGLDDLDTEDVCDRLFGCSLLWEFDLGTRAIRLHDVIRTFLRDERKADLAALNTQLLDVHRPAAGWGELADEEPYCWDHLAEHLIEAKCGEELVATVKDWRYLAKKTLLRKSPAVEKDLLAALRFAPETDPLRTLLRGYSVSSHLLNRCQTLPDVEASLFSRMRHFEELKAAIQELAQILKTPQVTPVQELPDLPHPALIRTLAGHSGYVNGCAFSPDGKLIVSASSDQTLKLWDADTGQALRTLAGHSASVNGCAFSPDGKLIVSASSDQTLKLWDAATGQALRTLAGHSASVRGCAFSPDGKLIVSASSDHTLKLWDAATGQALRTLAGHSGGVNGCAFSPDGKLIVSASSDQTLKLWDAATGTCLATFYADGAIFACAMHEELIVAGGVRGVYFLKLVG